MRKNYLILNLIILTLFMLPSLVNAQAIKDSIRENYTKEKYQNYLLKKQRGEIPRHDGPVISAERNNAILVNNNAGATGTGLFTQSETSILAFGNNILIGFNDSGSYDGEANKFTGFSYSTDGGNSFTDGGTLPDDVIGDLGDPVLARDITTGRIYFATLGFDEPETIQVFTSDDNGVTWNDPVVGTPGGDNEDKEWIAVDNFTGTGNGNVYLISRNFGAGNGIYMYRSTDNGATFGPNEGVQIVSASSGNQQGAFVAVGPDHSVYAFWLNTVNNTLQIRRSTDLGLTFDPAMTVVTGLSGPGINNGLDLTGIRNGFTTYSDFRSNSFPHAAINPVSGDIYVTYNDNPDGEDKGDIFFVMSTDGGATWSSPELVNDDGTTTDQWQPTVVVTEDGNHLAIFYSSREEDTEDNNLYKYYGRRATITGSTVTFSSSLVISDELTLPEFGRDWVVNSTYMGDYNQAAASGCKYHLVWSDNLDDLADGGNRKDPNVYYKSIPVTENTPPVAICNNIVVSADGGCMGYVTADQVDNGSYDPDGDPITLSVNPTGPYALGETEVTLTVDDGCLTDACAATITVVDDTPPLITCPTDIIVPNDPGLCSAVVEFEVTATDNCDMNVDIMNSPASRSAFPVGSTLVTSTATDFSGNQIECNFNIIVLDVEAPVITLNSEPVVLWPPNHKYETVFLSQMILDVNDNCDELSIADIDIVQVSSDEPENDQGDGDGNTLNDIIISPNCNYVDLRKERMGPGNGRVYDISLYVADYAGNVATALFSVMVLHDEDNFPAINDGPLYTVNGNCQGLRNVSAESDSKTDDIFNYPNPFKESTIIQFRLQKSENIRIIIYNSQGKEVATLFEGIAEAGLSYRVEFNGLNLPAGLYYYHLQSNEGVDIVKKMMLIK